MLEAHRRMWKRCPDKMAVIAYTETYHDRESAIDILQEFVGRFIALTDHDKFDKKEASILFREAYVMLHFFDQMFDYDKEIGRSL